jgi:hypothetical protein
MVLRGYIMMTDDKLIEEICELVKEYTCMEMGYFFRYDLRAKINQYYEDNCSQEVNKDD